MTAGPFSLYHPGDSFLHRAPVGVKLAGLLLMSVLVITLDAPSASAGVMLLGSAGLVWIGLSARAVWRMLRPFLVFAALIVAVQVLLGRADQGRDAALRMLAVAVAAILLTATTRPSEITDWLERVLRRAGVREDRVFRVGVLVGAALRSIDHLGVVLHRVLDARRARGLQRSVRAFAVPTVVSAARFAHDLGEALDARGIGAPQPPAEEPPSTGTSRR